VKYKIGQLVLNRKLGLGKVLDISGDEVVAFFKDQQVNPRTINVSVAPMEIPTDQSDPFFDAEDNQNLDRLRKPTKPRAAAKGRGGRSRKSADAPAPVPATA
jgi:hypothetical protein